MKQLDPTTSMKHVKSNGKQVYNMQKVRVKRQGTPRLFWRNEKEARGSATPSIYCTYLGWKKSSDKNFWGFWFEKYQEYHVLLVFGYIYTYGIVSLAYFEFIFIDLVYI